MYFHNTSGNSLAQAEVMHAMNPEIYPMMAESSLQKGLGAIGSERRTRAPDPNKISVGRPPSWQDEVGIATPRIPPTIGKLGPFSIDTSRQPQKSSRSTSFPENNNTTPQLTQLSHARTHPYDTSYVDGRAQQLSPPPMIHRNNGGWINTSINTSEVALPISPLIRSPEESLHRPTTSRSNEGRGIGYQLSPTLSHEQDHLASAFGGMQLRSKGSSIQAYASSRPQPNGGFDGRPSSAAQRPLLDEGLAMIRNIKTPSPTSESPESEGRAYAHNTFRPEAIAAARQEMMRNPQYAEEMRRYGQTLLQIATPGNMHEQFPIGLPDDEVSNIRDQTPLPAIGATNEYALRNGGMSSQRGWTYPGEFGGLGQPLKQESTYIVVVFKLHRAAIYYRPEDMKFASEIKPGDMIVVQADRGEDIGFVWQVTETVLEAEESARRLNTEHMHNLLSFVKVYKFAANRLQRFQLPSNYGQDLVYKSIVRKAGSHEKARLLDKEHDETKAKRIAEQKARERGLPMEILDAEFQADHGKLTIYFISEQYVVFKEFVDDMYKVYKMRVWMSSVNQAKPLR